MKVNKKEGATGLLIPVINPSLASKNTLRLAGVKDWLAALPMADVGVSAKKLFVTLEDLTNTELDLTERFEILEQLRATTKTIGTILKRHYIEQKVPLTQQKLTIANLRQTLNSKMADNYKLILEDLHKKSKLTEEDKHLMATVICRILYYFNVVLICRYQLYAFAPKNVWREIHILYKYGKAKDLLNIIVPDTQCLRNATTSIMDAYTRIILLYATDPYQWRQKDQHSINKAIDIWAVYPTIYDANSIPHKKPGVYLIDLDKDEPPIPATFKTEPNTASCIGLDLSKHVKHLQGLLNELSENPIQAKIEHPGDPEFSINITTLRKLICIWSKQVNRSSQRYPIQARINIAFGLIAAHYYLSGEKEFDSNPTHLRSAEKENDRQSTTNAVLPTFEILEEEEEETVEDALNSSKVMAEAEKKPVIQPVEENPIDNAYQEAQKELIRIYDYQIGNISPNGFCIVVKGGLFPPFQAGEIVVFKNATSNDEYWSIGAVRWIRRPSDDEFQIGIQLISPNVKAAGLQMLRDDKPTGRLMRCMIIPENAEADTPNMIIMNHLPFQAKQVLIYMNNQEIIKINLLKEIDATGMYHQYTFSTGKDVSLQAEQHEKAVIESKPVADDEETNTEFDSIWKDL